VHVTTVTMRRNPIFPATIVGRPPMEDFYLGHATGADLPSAAQADDPEIVDYHMPAEGIFHNLVFAEHPEGVSGAGLQGDERAVGAGADVAREGARRGGRLGERAQSAGGVVGGAEQHRPRARHALHDGPMDVLDHSSRAFTYGSKMGIDATRKLPEEGFTREWPPVIEMDDATKRAVDAMWPSLGIPTP
jgi:4-hydroxy-3-polyprenylbenzoate decarboxylase